MANYRCSYCDTIWSGPELLCWWCKKPGDRDDIYGLWLLKHYQETVDIAGV